MLSLNFKEIIYQSKKQKCLHFEASTNVLASKTPLNYKQLYKDTLNYFFKYKERTTKIMKQEIPPIMTFKECQQILHIGKNNLLAMLHDGRLQGFRIGSQWRITREEL